MIIIKLVGGLGNQLFQYALGKNMAIKNNSELLLDVNSYNFDYRNFELSMFNIKAKVADKKSLPFYEKSFKNKRLSNFWYLFNFLFKKLNPNHIIENPKHPIIHEGMYDFQPRILDLRGKNLYLEGFWQSEKYFKEIEDIVKEDLQLINQISGEKNIEILDKINSSNSISLHVRRGDYIGSHYAGICEKEYYTKAIKLITEKIKNPIFYIFSEDISWCRENLNVGNNDYFIDWNRSSDSYLDMILMSKCKHNIIANSTFSWWGAYLNENKNKVVIAPKKWHNNLDYKDIIPESWIRI